MEDEKEKCFNIAKEQWKLVPPYLKKRGLVFQHIDSFNYFLETDIRNIMEANRKVTCEADPNWFIEYRGIRVGTPSVADMTFGGEEKPVTPHECRIRDLTYSAPILVDFNYTVGKQTLFQRDVNIGRLPIMLRSSNCLLNDKSSLELSKMNECPHDPGGYFVVKGQEKVVLIQEQLSKNRIIVEKDKDGLGTCFCHSSTHDKKTVCHIVQKKKTGTFYIKQNALKENLPIAVLFKAFGISTDNEMFRLIGTEPEVQKKVMASILECEEVCKVESRNQAMKYLVSKLKGKMRDWNKPKTTKLDDAWEYIAYTLLGHVPVNNWDFTQKAIFLGSMVRRVILLDLGRIKMDDRDYYGNKRMELAGGMLSLLFEDVFKRFNEELQRVADKHIQKRRATVFDITVYMRNRLITNTLVTALSTGNWIVKRFRMDRRGVTQNLCRFSYISAFGMMTRIESQFEKTRKVSGPRSLHGSQWGMLCPADTPEGESCGLTKNLALLAHITVEVSADPVKKILKYCCVNSLCEYGGQEMHASDNYLVAINGLYCGITNQHEETVRRLRLLRRRRKIDQFISISTSRKLRIINIASDGGRLCRPYIVVEGGKAMVTGDDIIGVISKLKTFDDLLNKGKIEFLDVNEINDCYIALKRDAIEKQHTHLEIEEFAVLGAVAGLIPYPHHNQSPRNTYQCAMGKQAMGILGWNQQKRMDTIQYLLAYPQRPLVQTKTIQIINFNELPAGQNGIVAVMSYSGYDIEDAIVLNKASVDRGYGRCMVTKATKTVVKRKEGTEGLSGPAYDPTTGEVLKKHVSLDFDGLIMPGEKVNKRHTMVNKYIQKQSSMDKRERTAMPVSYHGPAEACIDDVAIMEDGKEDLLIKVKVRETRRPQLGDKFSSRHGQKGVTGLIVPQEDMPFNESGMVPDLIMNPHGFPSRMTVGKLLEFMGSKAAALEGKFHDGTAFGGDKVEDLSKILVDHGYNYLGKDILTSGITGEPLQAYVFMGPVYYQKLKHMVLDKMHGRGKGPKTQLTRQPTEGRARDGGLRLGEMERDCLIGYGASQLLMERLMISSDQFDMDVCGKCGRIGYSNYCMYCKSANNVSTIKIPYACKLLFQELMSMNINPKLILKPKFEKVGASNKT